MTGPATDYLSRVYLRDPSDALPGPAGSDR